VPHGEEQLEHDVAGVAFAHARPALRATASMATTGITKEG
jgi:hypothetical protein